MALRERVARISPSRVGNPPERKSLAHDLDSGHIPENRTAEGRLIEAVRILDIHAHIGRRRQLNPRMIDYFEETIGPETLGVLDHITPESFLGYLDQEGVDYCAFLAEYSPETTGIIPSEFIAGFCRSSDRLIPIGSVDLGSAEDAASQTERCVKELGCRGLKLLPSYGHFYPDDPRILPAYEVARDLGIPVMFHTGTSLFPGSRIRYANPLLLDDVAEDFPDLTIVMCHGGRPFWYKESEWMLARHRNCHIDVTGIPPKQLPEIFPKLEKFSDRFVFGSDWPNIPSIGRQVEAIRELPLSTSVIGRLLWEIGARMLGLDR